ncbi:MAG TPA: carbohydrate kinase [Streptosporangiaceae bacterium]|jgi:fructokinase
MITVAGEILIDLVDEGGGRYRAHPGGSPANVAVALARLGTASSLLARISRDELGRRLESHLDRNGVSLRDVVRVGEPTTLAIASLDGDGSAAYSFYVAGTADWQWRPGELPAELPADVSALHAGSLALALAPGAAALEAFLTRVRDDGRVTISIDPNIRPQLAGPRPAEIARVERQLALAHIVKASEDDIAWLYPGAAAEDVARRWQRLGPRLVTITLGGQGAYALGPDGTAIRRPAPPVLVADTVGAGDAFCAGMLDALGRRNLLSAVSGPGGHGTIRLASTDLAEVLDWAVLVAALTCERPGADPPTRAEALSSVREP